MNIVDSVIQWRIDLSLKLCTTHTPEEIKKAIEELEPVILKKIKIGSVDVE